MFAFLKRKQGKEDADATHYDAEANQLTVGIEQWEAKLAATPTDSEIHKALMLEYNRVLKVYAKSKSYRGHIDAIFVKMDELRNIIRKNI